MMRDCVICYEDIEGDDKKELDCGHTFHNTCIERWFASQRIEDWGSTKLDTENGEIIHIDDIRHSPPVVPFVVELKDK